MQKANSWLEELLSISEGTPYHSTLIVPKELRTQASTPESGDARILMQRGSVSSGLTNSENPAGQNFLPASHDLEISGITIFQLERGFLFFNFFIDNSNSYTEELEALAGSMKSEDTESKIILQISDLNFNYSIKINSHLENQSLLKGYIITTSFGESGEHLDGVTVLFQGLPEDWYGNKAWRYRQGVIHDDEVTLGRDDSMVIPSCKLGWRKLSAFDFKVDGWSVSLQEIPQERRNDPSIAHFCNITNNNKTLLTGEIVREFIEDNLLPFFSLLFGQNISFREIQGKRQCNLIWIEISRQPKISPKTGGNNWFLRCARSSSLDIESQFQNFYKLSSDIKKQWQKVINYYVISEEILETLEEPTTAASVSFSALEGLTRSIISTYQDRDKWLREDLRLKQGKGILNAIKMVAQQEFGKHSEVFAMASRQIYDVRNATMHLDLVSEENPMNALFRWKASQALIEILLLKKMGMMKIPNRTALGTFRVMGEDMFANQRREELRFDQDHSEGGSPPYP